MGKILCWLFGHTVEAAGHGKRVCVRCNQRETLRRFGTVIAWELVTEPAERGSKR